MSERGSNWGYSTRGSGFRGGRGRGGPRGFWRGSQATFRSRYDPGNRPYNSYGSRNPSQQWPNRPKREMPTKRLSEDAIGVTEYMNDNEGFIGIIKSRYSDFQVSEINEKGEIAKLTDLSPPVAAFEEAVDEDEDLLITKYNLEILPMDTWDKINTLAVAQATVERVEIDVTGMSKDQRTKIHDAVKKAFGDSIVGSTVSVEDKKLVRFEKYRKGVRIDNRVKWAWPGEYVHFVVHKENCDTMEAAARIAERLRLNVKPSLLGYAGTKDRRAKTSQWFSLRKVDPRRVAASCRGMRDILVGNYSFSANNLKLGMLKGNRFRIALRNVTADEDHVYAACRLLTERGFVNYYGLQRFGARIETPTYLVGLKMLQGKFKEAIASILEEREGPWQEALREFATHGAAAALRAWPRRGPRGADIEARLLRALAANPNDLIGALNKMARNTRLLYMHSYQSLVWNRAATARLQRLGAAPAPGDLVPLNTQQLEEELREDESDNGEDSETDSESQHGDGVDYENKMAHDTDRSTTAETPGSTLESSIKEKQKIPVKILTQEDVDSGQYSIFDVILPLPGNTVEYPPNMKEFYFEMLAKDGLNLEMKHKIRTYIMSGAYRHLAVRPLDVEWKCVRYTDPYSDLLPSDRDLLEGRTIDGIVEDGKYKALLVDMSLPSSCYATMALRELLKVDTSCDNQALQNNYHKKGEDKLDDSQKNESQSNESQKNESQKNESQKNESQKDESQRNESQKNESQSNESQNTEVESQKKIEESQDNGVVETKIEFEESAGKRKLESDSEGVDPKKVKQDEDK